MGASALAIDESEYLTRKEASDYLRRRWKQRVQPETLAKWAHECKGPGYFVTDTASRALYRKADLDAWARERLLPGRVAPVLAA